jgi:hypothetical protein
MRIIGISGKRQSGKDTLAAALAPKFIDARIASPSDWPKELLLNAGVPPTYLFGTDDEKRRTIPNTNVTGRDAVRRMYRELTRYDPLACIRRVIDSARCDTLIIPGVREVVDVEYIRSRGGVVIRLLRNPYPDDQSPEEIELDNYTQFDCVIPASHTQIETLNAALEFLGISRNSC